MEIVYIGKNVGPLYKSHALKTGPGRFNSTGFIQSSIKHPLSVCFDYVRAGIGGKKITEKNETFCDDPDIM